MKGWSSLNRVAVHQIEPGSNQPARTKCRRVPARPSSTALFLTFPSFFILVKFPERYQDAFSFLFAMQLTV